MTFSFQSSSSIPFLSPLFCTLPCDSSCVSSAFSVILSAFPLCLYLSPCYPWLAEVTAVRRVERDCAASLSALWLCLVVFLSLVRCTQGPAGSPEHPVQLESSREIQKNWACTFLHMDWHIRYACFKFKYFATFFDCDKQQVILFGPKMKLYSASSIAGHTHQPNCYHFICYKLSHSVLPHRALAGSAHPQPDTKKSLPPQLTTASCK